MSNVTFPQRRTVIGRIVPAMTRIIAALFLATVALTVTAPNASAGSRCTSSMVTPEEYAQLSPGQTFTEVRAIVGSKGYPMDPYWMAKAVGKNERTWLGCVDGSRSGGVGMMFDKVRGTGWVLEWTSVNWS